MKKIILIFFGFSVFSYAQDLKKETEKKQFPAEVQSQNLKEILEFYKSVFPNIKITLNGTLSAKPNSGL